MKNVKSKKQILLYIFIVLLIALCAVVSSNLLHTAYAQTTDDLIAHITENQYDFTNTDKPNGIKITDYAEKYLGKNAPLEHGLFTPIQANVVDDDDITKIIPKRLFQQVGVTQHIGKEYGFFIETRKPFEHNDMLISTVIIIDVTNKNDMWTDISHLKIQIKPIFQAEFAYVERGNDKIYYLDEQNYTFFKEKYVQDILVNYPAEGTGFVIPVTTLYMDAGIPKFGYLQHNKYYLTNAWCETSLYNVNHLNPYDDGYSPEKDMGCFFTQMDFNYNGFFLEKGKTNAEDVGSVIYNAASFAFDLYDKTKGLKSVFKAAPVVGQVITVADTIRSIVNIADDLKYQKISEGKEITYTAQHNNKEQQIASGGLHKDASITIRSNSEKDLLFGTNDFFEFDYQIQCQDIKVDTRYATMINFGVVSVVNTSEYFTQFGEVNYSSNVYSNELRNHMDNHYKEIPNVEIGGLKTNSDLNILPNCSGLAQLSPAISGNYKIELNNQYSKFTIYEVPIQSNGILDYNETSNPIGFSQKINGAAILESVFLDTNKNYLLVADLHDNVASDNVYGRYGIVPLEAELIKKDLNIGTNTIEANLSQEYLKFDSHLYTNYRFTLNSRNDVLNLLNTNFEVIDTSVDGELLVVFNKDETYYLRLVAASVPKTVGITVRDETNVQFENVDNVTSPFSNKLIVSSTDTVTLPIPEQLGKIFDGWWTNLGTYGENVTAENIFDYARPELHLYAKWVTIEYAITYVENEGETISDDKYTVDYAFKLNQNITRSGYVFCGWYDNAAFSGAEIKTIPAGSIGNKTFYAKWVKEKFTIRFDVNSEDTDGFTANFNPSDHIANNQQEVYFRGTYSLPIPELIGFTFDGWFYQDNLVSGSNPYTFEQDIELVAKWNRNIYYIKVLLQNESGAIAYQWLNSIGEELSFKNDKNTPIEYNMLSPNNYVTQLKLDGKTNQNNDFLRSLYKEGHKFVSFVHNASVPKPKVFDWSTLTKEEIANGNIIALEPYYVPEKEFKIYVEAVAGVTGTQGLLPSKDFGEVIDYKTAPTKIGYTFSGYVVSNNEINKDFYGELAKKQPFNYTKMPDLSQEREMDGVIIYIVPVFSPNSYVVTFDEQGLAQKTVIFDQVYNDFPIPNKKGYDFIGWYTGSNGTGDRKTDSVGNSSQWNIAHNCQLYAGWEPKEYKVTFDKQGGSGGTDYVIAKYGRPMPTKTTQGALLTCPLKTGYTFQGYYSEPNGVGTKYYNEKMISVYNCDQSMEFTIYAFMKANQYTVTLDKQGGAGGSDSVTATFDERLPNAIAPTKEGHKFVGYETQNGEIYYSSTMSGSLWNIAQDTILYAQWQPYSTSFDICHKDSADNDIYPVIKNVKIEYGYPQQIAATEFEGYNFTGWYIVGKYPKQPEYRTSYSTSRVIEITYEFIKELRIKYRTLELIAQYSSSCITEGTLITLSDGTQKAVEDLTGDEKLLVWNLFTGTFDTAPILFIDHDAESEYEVINLTFSDGTTVKVISEHGFFDLDLNEYVFLRRDAAKYIGHWFNKQTTDAAGNMSWTKVRLESVDVRQEYTTAWSPVTYGHLCYYVNGMLSMPGATTGLINIFDVNSETMKIDEEKYAADIAEYGLFTYEEFAELYPVPEVIFEAFGGQYLKVAMGKGLLTEDMLESLIARYSVFFEGQA